MGLVDHIRQTVPKDIVRELGPAGVACLLQLMADAYLDLRTTRFVQSDTSEDTITEEWFVYIQRRWRQKPAISFIPVHQKQDTAKSKARGKSPTVDVCFRDCFDNRSYFGAECKLLDAGNRTHLAAYLDDTKGIGRFVDGRYASNAGAGAMVGYVRSGTCDSVVTSLEHAIQRLSGKPKLTKSRPLRAFDQIYESQHSRDCQVAEFLCYHLLLGFNCSAA